jgi:hypothetical protein
MIVRNARGLLLRLPAYRRDILRKIFSERLASVERQILDLLGEHQEDVCRSALHTSCLTILSRIVKTVQVVAVLSIILNDSELQNEAMKLLRKQVRDQLGTVVQSINHVEDNGFLRCRPIAVSIETKTADGGESVGRTQLSIWGAAHLMRLQAAAEPVTCSAAGTPAPGRSRNALTTALPNTEISSTTTDDNLGLPLVLVVGSKWTVYFLVDHGEYLVRWILSDKATWYGEDANYDR